MEGLVIKMKDTFWKNKNVFVTGCTGFLGSYLSKELIKLGANVVGLVRDFIPNSNLFCEPSLYSMNIVNGSLEDLGLIERILGEYEIDTVFHLAAQAIVGVANRNPLSTFQTNILGTWNILEACRRSPLVKRIIVASSDKAYGDQKVLPYDESMPLQGKHPYDVSKSCADLIAQSYYHTYRLPVCITRCGNLYGGGDLNFNRIIPQTIKSIIHNEAPIIRSDGTFIRDYFYVEDAVQAYLLLAEKMEDLSLYGEAFNFSNEIQLTVLDLVNKILEIMNSDLKPIILQQGQNEIKHQYLSAEKARIILNWKPIFTIEEGLKKTIEWYTSYFHSKG
ncbi:GDP-mannose 4,6-dehydratase [Thermotalea metallivorans]|uniref:CDP-glucose 4,6-dehydratase n=1 Tax=Thermotalea metallivorans TaxID=520762 RepID=A0A140L0H8_9FIRM|nr:GDP-mannose 4,6-dehydratase [Thermotalea metallivorans]KXG74053.1 CDP-glucose 4,6-dehydratase [Thermotalea metallivorans]